VRESWLCSQSSVRHVTGGGLHSYTAFPSRAWPKRQPQLCEFFFVFFFGGVNFVL